jgi:hypothetical protein
MKFKDISKSNKIMLIILISLVLSILFLILASLVKESGTEITLEEYLKNPEMAKYSKDKKDCILTIDRFKEREKDGSSWQDEYGNTTGGFITYIMEISSGERPIRINHKTKGLLTVTTNISEEEVDNYIHFYFFDTLENCNNSVAVELLEKENNL